MEAPSRKKRGREKQTGEDEEQEEHEVWCVCVLLKTTEKTTNDEI
jgi:hypothetical protein